MVQPKRNLPADYEISVGDHKGHKVTKHVSARPSRTAQVNKHAKFVRDLVREVSGLQPYEKRVCELLKIGKDKRALKFIKRRLGAHSRSKKKRDEMSAFLQSARRAAK